MSSVVEDETKSNGENDGVKLSAYAESALHKVATAEGFVHYKFQIEEGSSVGDGFSGILLKVAIVENDSSRELNVIVKSPPEDVFRREVMGTIKLFEREVFMYSELLPEFVKFQQENHLNLGFYEFPKCYFAEYDKENKDAVIIMDDLKHLGYKMIDKNVPINYEHAKLSMAAIGRFHAISFALRDKNPTVFERFQKLDDITATHMDNEMMTSFFHGCVDRAIETLRDDEVKRRNKMLNLKDNMKEILKDLGNPAGAEPYAVVIHGDCWPNNFLFKYRVSVKSCRLKCFKIIFF